MKQVLSRRDFLKGAAASAAGAAAAATLGGLVLPASAQAGAYTPGTYSATTQGMGDVVVTMTFDQSSITAATVDVSGETEGIGAGLGEQFAQQILASQSAALDAVSGATVTSSAVKAAAQACIDQATGATITVADESAAGEEDWLGAPPQIGEIAQTLDFDVVVVGAGLAGICAARAAAEEGAKVAVIEKSASFNCRSGEYALLNGSLNQRWGRENIVDTDVVVDRLMRECTYRNKRAILKR